MQRFLCWMGFHPKPLRTERSYLIRDRSAPTPSYEGIPESAQVRTVITLRYIIDLWEDCQYCDSCKRRVSSGRDVRYGRMEYNEMIYLQNGRVFIASPALIEG
jgi:hypothetical protein